MFFSDRSALLQKLLTSGPLSVACLFLITWCCHYDLTIVTILHRRNESKRNHSRLSLSLFLFLFFVFVLKSYSCAVSYLCLVCCGVWGCRGVHIKTKMAHCKERQYIFASHEKLCDSGIGRPPAVLCNSVNVFYDNLSWALLFIPGFGDFDQMPKSQGCQGG